MIERRVFNIDIANTLNASSFYKIGVVGLGIVGGAVFRYFQRQYANCETLGYDVDAKRNRNVKTLTEMLQCDFLFLCLPTLYDVATNRYDLSAINSVCNELSLHAYQGLVVLKSTVESGTTEQLAQIYTQLRFVHNPEFISEKTCDKDFEEQVQIVIGTLSLSQVLSHVLSQPECNQKEEEYKKQVDGLCQLFKQCFPAAIISVCSSVESETMKIAVNCFYATKILFFNELYAFCSSVDANYDTVKELMIKNGWINKMHTTVPGSDGKFGFGGMCFPKDTSALLAHMKRQNTPRAIMEAVVKENAEVFRKKSV